MAQSKKKAKKSAKKEALAEMFAAEAGERFELVVVRDGNARQREILVNGSIRLNWRSNGESMPIELPEGHYTLRGVILGKAGQTWGFSVLRPHLQPLKSGVLTALEADMFDRGVDIP